MDFIEDGNYPATIQSFLVLSFPHRDDLRNKYLALHRKICADDNYMKSAIVACQESVLETAKRIARCIAFQLGIYHDRYGSGVPRKDSRGIECKNGLMDPYGDYTRSWSQCSEEYFKETIHEIQPFCMDHCQPPVNEKTTTASTSVTPLANVPVSSTMKATDNPITTTTQKICKDIQIQLCDYNAFICYYDRYYRSQCEKSCGVC